MQNKSRQSLEKNLSARHLLRFVGDVKSEFKKVVWTSKEELKVYTQVVVVTTFVCGMLVFFADLVIKNVLEAINFALRVFGG